MPRDDAERRIALQATDEERRDGRDLGASTTPATSPHLEQQIDEIWPELERARPKRAAAGREAAGRARPARDDVTVSPRRYPRCVPEFELVTDMEPAGDQPEAIAALVDGRRAGRPVPDAARHHRVGQELHDRQRDRAGAAAHAGARAEQVAGRAARGRVPRVLPEEPGRVLRLLLRLLPARGVHPVDRHVHREGQLDQRRDRPAAPLGHERAAHPPRRDHRRVGLGDLRPRLARDVRASSC